MLNKVVVLLNCSLVLLSSTNGSLLEDKLNQQISRDKTHLLNLSIWEIAGNTEERRKVSDYFLQTPEQYFKIEEEDEVNASIRVRLLEQSGTIVDQENGYIRTSSIYPDLCNYEMAIFRRSLGSHLVALNVRCTIGDRLYIIDSDKNWRDVTKELFPIKIPLQPFFYVNLPRYGRTIIITKDDVVIAKVFFDGDRFQATDLNSKNFRFSKATMDFLTKSSLIFLRTLWQVG